MEVSVIIPCYNGEDYIGQTLGSLLDQTRPADEIIVVDDGSTDRSAEIAQSFGVSVTVLSKGGGGAAMTRNCGADHASGDAIMFLDADDLLAPDALEHLIEELKRNPEGVVACPWYRLEKIGNKWVKRPPSCKSLGKNQDYLSGWLTGWYHVPCSILWSRHAYKNTGGWDPRAYVNDDGDLMMRALADGVPLKITGQGASFYRRMPDEQLTESLSGARFTRKGREAQIYVIHKIAQMLEDRNKLKDYREPLTQAFKQYRHLCEDQYPDLSKHCSELIEQYGESRYMQIARKFERNGRQVIYSVRRRLGLLKKNVLDTSPGSNNHSANQKDKDLYGEIRYGLDTCQKFKKAGKKGKIIPPSNPEVSVILPLSEDFNAFSSSLKSVLNQDFENFEVIVIGIKNPAISISNLEMDNDSRIRFVTAENNGGIAALRNRGLKVIKGDFVAFLDPGDEWHLDKLVRQIECFRKASEEVGLVYTGADSADENDKTKDYLPGETGDVHKKLLQQNIIECSSSVVIRRTVIPAVGFFDSRLIGLENHDYWLRIARYFKFEFIDESLVINHALHGQSKMAINEYGVKKNSDVRSLFLKKHLSAMKRVGAE